MGDKEEPAFTGRGLNIPPSSRAVETVGVSPERAQYLEAPLLQSSIHREIVWLKVDYFHRLL